MTSDRLKTVSDIISTWVGLIALLAGGAFGIVQYIEKSRGDKVKVTLDFLQQQNRDPLWKVRKNISNIWQQHYADLHKAWLAPGASPETVAPEMMKIIDKENSFHDFMSMVDFYESVEICISSEICDEATAGALFYNDARRFYNLYYPVIAQYRKARNEVDFGAQLDKFLTRGIGGVSTPP